MPAIVASVHPTVHVAMRHGHSAAVKAAGMAPPLIVMSVDAFPAVSKRRSLQAIMFTFSPVPGAVALCAGGGGLGPASASCLSALVALPVVAPLTAL